MINLLKKEQEILQFLFDWDERKHYLYNLEDIHSIATYAKVDDDDYHMKEYFGVDLTQHYKHQLFQFATDGAGGAFSFWQYDGLVGEAPVVFLDSEGGGKYYAANLEDFVSLIIHNIDLGAGWRRGGEPLEDDLVDLYEQLSDDYEDENGDSKTEKEIINLLTKQRQEFKEEVSKLMTVQSQEEIDNNLKKHPSFEDWFEEVEKKYR